LKVGEKGEQIYCEMKIKFSGWLQQLCVEDCFNNNTFSKLEVILVPPHAEIV